MTVPTTKIADLLATYGSGQAEGVAEAEKIRGVLLKAGLSKADAAVLTAWMGGAPKHIPAIKFWDKRLDAQDIAEVEGFNDPPDVDDALATLRAIDKALADLVEVKAGVLRIKSTSKTHSKAQKGGGLTAANVNALKAKWGWGPARSAVETLDFRKALVAAGMSSAGAAVLAAWIGGAPPRPSVLNPARYIDNRVSAEEVAEKEGFSDAPDVDDALDELRDLSAKLHELVKSKGTSKQAKATKSQDENADQDADKVFRRVKSKAPLVIFAVVGLGVVVTVGVVVARRITGAAGAA